LSYFKYSRYLKNKYGVKTYKIPVNVEVNCPNRDGNLDYRGSFYCGENGAVFENMEHDGDIKCFDNIRQTMLRNFTLTNFIIESKDDFLRTKNSILIYFQIVALCARNCTMLKKNPAIAKRLEEKFRK
jgi:radical SAM superfamily enzyme